MHNIQKSLLRSFILLNLLLFINIYASAAEEVLEENSLDITDINKQISELTKAANSGDPESQFLLGEISLRNNNPPDHATAVYWFRIASESNHLKAQEMLGAHLFMGLGVPQDSHQASVWWLKAAHSGSVKAQASLGVLYALGNGIKKDLIESYKWLSIAGKNGNDEAIMQRDNSIALQMNAEEIREAQKRIKSFVNKSHD